MQTILIVEDDRALGQALVDTLELEGYTALLASDGRHALALLERATVDLVITDVHMEGMDGHQLLRALKQRLPGLPVLLMTAYGSIGKAVEAMREGASDYLVKPFEFDLLTATVARHVRPAVDESEPVAVDPRGRELFSLAARVAQTDVTVLILGESGTGKEVLARYIHRHSRRAQGPFVAINCAAIPENMLEATLFGYEKGAFTGAIRAVPGKFEQAQGGTLLLDEISEMDLGLQAKLLRVLQEREVERLGGGKLIPLDVRVLATSNRDMREAVAQGRFREDLYYRLAVFPLRSPALRERPDDIPALAERSLSRAALNRPVPRLSAAARERLRAYPFPGNVRELDNLMQRAMILQTGDVIEVHDLHFEQIVPGNNPVPAVALADADPSTEEADGLGDHLRQQEYHLILDALRTGNRKQVAERLGISPRTLRYKIARMRDQGLAVPD